MSYFDDQEDAWFENGCEGNITDIDPYEFWASKRENKSRKKINKTEKRKRKKNLEKFKGKQFEQ